MDNPSEQNYLSSKDAGAILGYTHDYISRLCRHGKMSGIQKGREWYVTQDELDAFKGRHELELQEKKKELSKKFSQIRLDFEAKKRKAREEGKTLITNSVAQSTVNTSAEPYQKSIQFVLPKQFVAIALFAVALLAPTLINNFSKSSITLKGNTSSVQNYSVKEIGTHIAQGIQDTIYAQSTVVEPVAAIFSFAPHLAEGYWVFFTTIGELPREIYHSMRNIGNAYLTLYVLQGEALYESILSLDTMGAVVLRGYELIGESVWFGGKDIIKIYSRILHLDSPTQTGSRQINTFTANVSGGFEYVAEEVNKNVFENGAHQAVSIFLSLKKNIGINVSSMQATVTQLSQSVGAYVGSLFEFNLVEKDERIRAIRLEK